MLDTIAHADNWALWITAVVGGLIALGWLLRHAFKVVRFSVRLARVLDYQMRTNGGKSMLDRITTIGETQQGLVEEVGNLRTDVDTLRDEFRDHLHVQQTQAEAQREVWPAIKAVAEAQPPDQQQ